MNYPELHAVAQMLADKDQEIAELKQKLSTVDGILTKRINACVAVENRLNQFGHGKKPLTQEQALKLAAKLSGQDVEMDFEDVVMKAVQEHVREDFEKHIRSEYLELIASCHTRAQVRVLNRATRMACSFMEVDCSDFVRGDN